MGIYASPSGLLIAERDPTLALYPIAIDDFAAGYLLNAQSNVNATMGGGSTLLLQEKRRNDYQRLTSTFPTLGYRASGAYTNLDYALDPDNPSAEGGTAGTHTATGGGITVITTDFWHGSRCFKQTPTGAAPTFDTDLMAVTAAGTQYTTAAMVKATATRTIRASLIGDTSVPTSGDFTATGDWQLVYVTKTFAAGDTTSRDRSILLTDGIAGDTFLVDAIITVTGGTVPMFEESECVATSATFPTPFAAGEPVSFLCFVWTPWAGNDGVAHVIFSNIGAGNNRLYMDKPAGNYLRISTIDNAGAAKHNIIGTTAINWPAGSFHAIAASLPAAGDYRLALDGVLATAPGGAGVRESAVGAVIFLTNPLNGLILPYIYRGVAWGDEECEYYSTLQAPPPRTRMVA